MTNSSQLNNGSDSFWFRPCERKIHRCMEPLEKSEFQAFIIGHAKSTSYFIQLRPTPDFDLIQSTKANRLIGISKTIRSIEVLNLS